MSRGKLATLSSVGRIMVQPDDGVGPVVAMINGAHESVAIKMFTFTSPALLDAVIAAHQRGVRVRVMLNESRSSGSRANDDTFERLRAAGLDVAWTAPQFAVTHEKSMVIDGRTVLIATFNFVDKYFTHTRDYGVVVEDPAAIAEVVACFEDDWHRRNFALPDRSPLLWSATNARETMSAFIDGAEQELLVQHPKYSDVPVLDRLLAAAGRGVKVKVLCGGRHGISDTDMFDTFGSLRILERAGIRIRKQNDLRLHAKLLIADRTLALTGSMNIDRSAFDLRRELGLVTDDAAAVRLLRRRFEADWDDGHKYRPPDPMALHLHLEPTLPPDAELDHE